MIKIVGHSVNLLFLTIAVYFAVKAGYGLLRGNESPVLSSNRAVVEKPTVTDRQRHPLAYYHPIVERDLFHTRTGTPSGSPTRPSDLEIDKLAKTQLQLKLWGTVASPSGGNAAYAVIESEKEHKQHLYRVGDTVEGAVLKMILREKVILTRDGRDEVLEIEKPLASGGKPSIFSSAPRAFPAGIHPSFPGITRRRITLRRSQIDTAMSNIGQLMGEARIEPVRSGGGQGLIVSQIKPDSLFRRMGLRNGDIITEVDGKTIQSVDDALQLYGNLKSSDTVSVAIKRHGYSQLIEYRIR
jgi:general secretion pathway protein C